MKIFAQYISAHDDGEDDSHAAFITSSFFEDWFEFELLAAIPEGSLVIMDNASFHRKNYRFKIAERYGVYLLFLAYSPDLNPIEKSWANFKSRLCDTTAWVCGGNRFMRL